MAKDLDLPVKVIGVKTVREKDGLALSSRNAYLSAAERAAAPTLYRVLKWPRGAHQAEASRSQIVLEEGARRDRARRLCAGLSRGAPRLDAGAHCHSRKDGPIRLLVAAKIGKTRLIDNIGV